MTEWTYICDRWTYSNDKIGLFSTEYLILQPPPNYIDYYCINALKAIQMIKAVY